MIVHRRRPLPLEEVRVHVDLNQGLLSVMGRSGDERDRRLINCTEALLYDVRFVVQPGGLARCRDSGQREVCAYAVGHWQPDWQNASPQWTPVRFNPMRTDTFVTDSGLPVLRAGAAFFYIDDEGKGRTTATNIQRSFEEDEHYLSHEPVSSDA